MMNTFKVTQALDLLEEKLFSITRPAYAHENEAPTYHVKIGRDPSCTCLYSQKTSIVCKHRLWVMLFLLKIPEDNYLLHQKAFTPTEVKHILRRDMEHNMPTMSTTPQSSQATQIQQHSIQQHPTQQHSTQQHPTQQHSTQQHPTQQHSTQQHSTQQHLTQQHPTQQHLKQQHPTQQHLKQQHPTQQHLTQQHPTQQHLKQQHPTQQHLKQQHPTQQHLTQQHPTQQHLKQQHPTQQHLTQQHPTQQHLKQQHPTQQHLTQQHPTQQHLKQQHPTQQHLTQQHPTQQHPTQQHPTQQHLTQQTSNSDHTYTSEQLFQKHPQHQQTQVWRLCVFKKQPGRTPKCAGCHMHYFIENSLQIKVNGLYIPQNTNFSVSRTYHFCVDLNCISRKPPGSNLLCPPVNFIVDGTDVCLTDVERAIAAGIPIQ